jgi:hypothetical protein
MENAFGKKKIHFPSWAESANAAHRSVPVLFALAHVSRDSPPNPLLTHALTVGNLAAATPVQSACRPPAAAEPARLCTCLALSCHPRAAEPSPHSTALVRTLPLPGMSRSMTSLRSASPLPQLPCVTPQNFEFWNVTKIH